MSAPDPMFRVFPLHDPFVSPLLDSGALVEALVAGRPVNISPGLAYALSGGAVGEAPDTASGHADSLRAADYILRQVGRGLADAYAAEYPEGPQAIAESMVVAIAQGPDGREALPGTDDREPEQFVRWIMRRLGDDPDGGDEASPFVDSVTQHALNAALRLASVETRQQLSALREQLAAERAERAAAEAQAEAERSRREEAERQLRRAESQLDGLGDRTVFPGQLIRSGYHDLAQQSRRLLAQLGQGELFPLDDSADGENLTEHTLRNGAELVASQSQLGRLTPTQVRALFAVFRLFTARGDNGATFDAGPLDVPARLFYKAGGLTTTRDKDRRRLFDALREVAAINLHVALTGETPDGRRWVTGKRTHLFTFEPTWIGSEDKRRDLTDDQARALAHEWAALGDDPSREWAGALPDIYAFDLPDLMRAVWDRLVLNGDILDRLDAGAKQERGARESFSTMDWRLFIEITQREQTNQRTPDGSRFLSFVDRAALLEDVYGAEQLAKARRVGSYRAKYESQYEKAVAVLKAAGIAERTTKDHRTSDGGLRDVFAIEPTAVLGTQRRLSASKGPAKGVTKRATKKTTAGERKGGNAGRRSRSGGGASGGE